MSAVKQENEIILESSSLSNLNLSAKPSSVSAKPSSVSAKPPFLGFGILCCIISGLLFSFNALLVKMIFSITPIQMFASRCFVQFCILLPVVTYGRYTNNVDITGPPGMFKLLVTRGIVGSTGALLLYLAVANLSLGDAITISFSNVVITALIAFICLGESFTLVDGLLCVLTLGGVTLIAQPSFIFGDIGSELDTKKIIGILCGVGCAIFSAFTFVIVRKLGKDTPAVLNILYYSFAGSLVNTCVVGVTDTFQLPCYSELLYVFLLGVLGVSAQIFLTIGLQYERAGTFAVLRSLQIVVVFVLQVIFLNDIPTLLSVAGSGLIFLTIVIVAIRKLYNHKRQQKSLSNLSEDKSQ
uniref:Solute carrier family 35 member G1 n=1 Tax=Phallusia mammillata TaxID=59560 RepID=A0A6F9DSY8_9ASCI|nr:solute carrier family 35 member G1 [Phallusia mammillata]